MQKQLALAYGHLHFDDTRCHLLPRRPIKPRELLGVDDSLHLSYAKWLGELGLNGKAPAHGFIECQGFIIPPP